MNRQNTWVNFYPQTLPALCKPAIAKFVSRQRLSSNLFSSENILYKDINKHFLQSWEKYANNLVQTQQKRITTT